MKKTLFLRIFLGYAAVIVLLAAAVAIFAPPAMRALHIEERSASLEHMALLLDGQVVDLLTESGPGDLAGLVTTLGRETGTRITVIDTAGNVLADSEKESRDMENHFFRPEIQASLRGEKQMSIRPSSTLGASMMYMSVPLEADGRIVGALRLSHFMKDFQALMAALRADLLKVIAVVTAVALVLAFFLTRSVAAPVGEVIDASTRVAAGNFDVFVSTRRSGEFRGFAQSFNAMTGRLKEMFGEVRLQNEEIRRILASVKEGLCVLDGNARIVMSNDSFRQTVGHAAPEGRHFWEVVRSSAAAEIVRRVRDGEAESAGEVAIGDRFFLCSASRLAAADRVVVTLCDVTESRAVH